MIRLHARTYRLAARTLPPSPPPPDVLPGFGLLMRELAAGLVDPNEADPGDRTVAGRQLDVNGVAI